MTAWTTTTAGGVRSVTSPNGSQKFLGRDSTYGFGSETVRLDLELKEAGLYSIAYDLYIINTWDGNSSFVGHDKWQSYVQGHSDNLVYTSFNFANSSGQAYPGVYPYGNSPNRTGSIANDRMGFAHADSTYRIERTINHTGGSLKIEFVGLANEATSNESWGLDNVTFSAIRPTKDISSISPLSSLLLTTLSLQNQSIAETSPLAAQNNLEQLNLRGNNIADLSAMAGVRLADDIRPEFATTDIAGSVYQEFKKNGNNWDVVTPESTPWSGNIDSVSTAFHGDYRFAPAATVASSERIVTVGNVAPVIDSQTIVGVVAGRQLSTKISFSDPGDELNAEFWETVTKGNPAISRNKYRARNANYTYSIDYGVDSLLSNVAPTRVWAYEDELPIHFVSVPVRYSTPGNKSFILTINDGTNSVSRTFAVNVAANSAPVVSAPIPNLIVTPDTTDRLFYADLQQVFGDPDNSVLTYAITGNSTPSLVTPTIDANGILSLDLASIPSGSSNITISATDGVSTTTNTFEVQTFGSSGNQAPIANPDSFAGSTLAVSALNVLTNDTDPENDPIHVTHVNGVNVVFGTPIQLTLGRLELVSSNGNVNFHFFPNGSVGTQLFDYTISDGQLSSTATTTLTLVGINNPPVANNDSFGDGAPLVLEDIAFSGNVQTNDTDPDGDLLTRVLLTQPSKGSVSMLANGDFTFTPNANTNGATSFTYRLLDGRGGLATGTVSLTITSVNDAPAGTDKTITLTRAPNVAAVDMIFGETDFGFLDTLDSPSNLLSGDRLCN